MVLLLNKRELLPQTYFSSKITPMDVTKRREFLRGLDDYISNKTLKKSKKLNQDLIANNSPKK